MIEEIAWQWVTASMVITRRPCHFLGAFLTPSGDGSACSFYDGADTGGKLIATIKAAVTATTPLVPPGALPCYNGLYVDATTKVTGILVCWKPIPWQKEG